MYLCPHLSSLIGVHARLLLPSQVWMNRNPPSAATLRIRPQRMPELDKMNGTWSLLLNVNIWTGTSDVPVGTRALKFALLIVIHAFKGKPYIVASATVLMSMGKAIRIEWLIDVRIHLGFILENQEAECRQQLNDRKVDRRFRCILRAITLEYATGEFRVEKPLLVLNNDSGMYVRVRTSKRLLSDVRYIT